MEIRYFIAIIIVALAGVLYAMVNICPNRYKSSDPLIKFRFIWMVSILGFLFSGAMVVGMFKVNTIFGIATVYSFLIGFFLAWYVIKIPERRYIKEHLK